MCYRNPTPCLSGLIVDYCSTEEANKKPKPPPREDTRANEHPAKQNITWAPRINAGASPSCLTGHMCYRNPTGIAPDLIFDYCSNEEANKNPKPPPREDTCANEHPPRAHTDCKVTLTPGCPSLSIPPPLAWSAHAAAQAC